MSSRILVLVMAAVLALYIALVAQRAYLLLTSAEPILIVMGVALIVLPVIAAWALGRELWFGFRAERIARRLESEGGLPEDQVAVRPSGRISREDGAAVFPAYRSDVESHPDDWRAWYRLALAYDAAGDRRRARSAVRQAIRLETADRPS